MQLFQRLLDVSRNYLDHQPILALALDGALLIVFLAAAFRTAPLDCHTARAFLQSGGRQLRQLSWALLSIALLISVVMIMKTYLNLALADFRQRHGRISETNYQAVQTIWGPEQRQCELTAEFGYDEEVTERIEFEDQTKPALLKKKTVHQIVPANPFESARHEVTLRQNPRKKGSAVYAGYETENEYTYRLKYPGDHDVRATFRFPLPSTSMVCNDLVVNLNGQSVLNRLQFTDGALILPLDVPKGWEAALEIKFKSRGMSYWYFQVSEARVIRDFALTLHLPELPKDKLNFPEGCMTPTEIVPTGTGHGCDLIYRLGNAVSSKGMGIALAKPEQPGRTTSAVLVETPTAWTLLFSAILLGLTLSGARQTVLFSILTAIAAAFGYGLLGNFHDIVLGFWGSAAVVLLPLFILLAWLLKRAAVGVTGRLLAAEVILFGIVYPALAGLDEERQPLYLNICALVLLAITAWQLLRTTGNPAAFAPGDENHAVAAS